MRTYAHITTSSLVSYGGGSKLSILAKRSVRPRGGSETGESNTESGIASMVSSKNDFTVYKDQKFS